jgi:hypothetical protein
MPLASDMEMIMIVIVANDGGASYGSQTRKTIMSTDITNASAYTKTLLSIIDAKDKSDTGAFTMIGKHAEDVAELFKRVDHAKGFKETSVRGVLLEHFFSDPTAAKIGDRYNTLVEMKSGVSSIQRLEKAQLKRKMNNVVMMLTRLCDVHAAITRIENAGFTVQFRGVPNSAATVCRIRGKDDEDFAPFSVTQVLRLVNASLDNLTSYAQLQDKAKTARQGTANKQANGAEETIAASNVAKVAASLDNAIAGLTFDKDGGLSPGARDKMLRLWAHMDALLTDEQKAKARAEFDADAAPEDDEDEAAA